MQKKEYTVFEDSFCSLSILEQNSVYYLLLFVILPTLMYSPRILFAGSPALSASLLEYLFSHPELGTVV
jgi:hypothetical protein